MARSTPTFTPVGKYALGSLISLALLFSDLTFQTFSSSRGLIQATGIYSQLILTNIFDSAFQFSSAYKDKKDLIKINQNLRDEILMIQNKNFLDEQSQLISHEILKLQENLKEINGDRASKSFQVASVDLKNYFCCSSHSLYLKNPNNFNVKSNLPVSNGKTFIGQTSGMDLNLVKVILFSDASHILPIKIKDFYCNASGAGMPLKISCLAPRNLASLAIKINDLTFTSGMGGIFPNNIAIGRVIRVTNINADELEILIELAGNPLKQNYFGILLNS